MKKKLFLIAALGASLFVGCGESQPQVKKQTSVDLTPWTTFCDTYTSKYNQNGGLAACKCKTTTDITDNFSMTIAENKARQELAKDLSIKVKGLIESHQKQTNANNKKTRGSNYEETARQIVNQSLQGAYPVAHKVFKVPNSNKYQMCAVVALNPDKVKNIIKEISNQTNIEDNSLLYEEFKSIKAQKRLDEATK
jgi:hypothetical protein